MQTTDCGRYMLGKTGAVSLVCKAEASTTKIPIYQVFLYVQHIANLVGNKTLMLLVPTFNGGSHAGNKFTMQEFMILLVGGGASSFKEARKMGVEDFVVPITNVSH